MFTAHSCLVASACPVPTCRLCKCSSWDEMFNRSAALAMVDDDARARQTVKLRSIRFAMKTWVCYNARLRRAKARERERMSLELTPAHARECNLTEQRGDGFRNRTRHARIVGVLGQRVFKRVAEFREDVREGRRGKVSE